MEKKLERLLERTYGYVDDEAVKQLLCLCSVSSSKLTVGDSFVLTAKKPKTTFNQEYIVAEVRYNSESGFEYMFYNDHDKPSVMYDGDYCC